MKKISRKCKHWVNGKKGVKSAGGKGKGASQRSVADAIFNNPAFLPITVTDAPGGGGGISIHIVADPVAGKEPHAPGL